MLDIHVKTVPDDHQRYNTVGDYFVDEHGKKVFVVSDMRDWHYEFLTVLHELVESALCKERGISDESIDAFDAHYEANRKDADGMSEPGDSPDAPYHKEHVFASKIERMIADEMGIDWDNYNKVVEKLMLNKEVI